MSDIPFFDELFQRSRQITPYLHGQLKPFNPEETDSNWVQINGTSGETIRALYENLKTEHPEAGSAYWLTRTWTLLCWQPIYVAFVAIYACRGLPLLSQMAQNVQPTFVSGYQFNSDRYIEGSEQQLIEQAGNQLATLFEYFRSEMSLWTRIRPGFTAHLFADGVLACLVKLHKQQPRLSGNYLLEQARLWLSACGLPAKLSNTLTYDPTSHQLSLVRTSCCLVYKCQGRKLCNNCPRHPDNKTKSA